MMPADLTGDEVNAPELPRRTDDDCECDGYPGAHCGCWRRRTEEP